MATHSNLIAWRIPWSWDCKELDTTERLHFHFHGHHPSIPQVPHLYDEAGNCTCLIWWRRGLKVTCKCYLARGECPSVLGIPAAGCCSLMCRKAPGLFSNPPVIAARPFTIPYLTALLPSELEMQQMEETDSSEQDEQTDTENLPLHISPVGLAFHPLPCTPRPHPPQEPMLLTACLPRGWTGSPQSLASCEGLAQWACGDIISCSLRIRSVIQQILNEPLPESGVCWVLRN